MNNYIKHTFNKPWFSQSETCDVFCISETWLKTQMRKLLDEGRDLNELGHFIIEGKRDICKCEKAQTEWSLGLRIQSLKKELSKLNKELSELKD